MLRKLLVLLHGLFYKSRYCHAPALTNQYAACIAAAAAAERAPDAPPTPAPTCDTVSSSVSIGETACSDSEDPGNGEPCSSESRSIAPFGPSSQSGPDRASEVHTHVRKGQRAYSADHSATAMQLLDSGWGRTAHHGVFPNAVRIFAVGALAPRLAAGACLVALAVVLLARRFRAAAAETVGSTHLCFLRSQHGRRRGEW